MATKNIIFILVFIISLTYLYTNLKRLYDDLKVGRPDKRWDNQLRRIKHMLIVAFGQTRLFRDPVAGFVHVGIFWGFLVLLFSAFQSVLEGFGIEHPYSFLGSINKYINLFTDIFCVIVIVSVIISLIRRYVIKIPRLQGDKYEIKDAIIVLLSIFIIVSGLLLQNSFLIVNSDIESSGLSHQDKEKIEKPLWDKPPEGNSKKQQQDIYINWMPFSGYIAGLISPVSHISNHKTKPLTSDYTVESGISQSTAQIWYEIFWWLHILGILTFINYLPFSKHLHVYTSIHNVFFTPEIPTNRLEKIDFEQEGVEKFGIVDIDDMSWKSIFDGYSCTHCGRCTDVCPAHITGKQLSPREIIVQVRQRTKDAAHIIRKIQKNNEYQPTEAERCILDKKLVGEYEDIEALWQCTTCGACMQECPVTIEHVPVIVGMRRSLVMMESNFPPLLQSAFTSMENNGSPWAFPASERADWASGLGVPLAAGKPDFDVLFWVGCAGSFDDRNKKVSVALAKLMQSAGVNFAILGSEEKCNGDVARRSGNEYLADTLIKANVETMNGYNIKKIVTACPHCFNTLKNEYPDFGGNYEVLHHSQYLFQLLDEERLKISKPAKEKLNVVYHDSCYLSRYNKIISPPRQTLGFVPGINIIEPPRCGDKGLCCGAGGAQMFMEETVGKRVNIERTEELLATGAKTIGINCPFCLTMLSDGVKAKNEEENVDVKDISEILIDFI
ncbi:MAG: Fe-S oxidoreductase [Ignavibacteria bacterium]|nr:Fe-S oxidoreductase [Ignavibacteria bacterium]